MKRSARKSRRKDGEMHSPLRKFEMAEIILPFNYSLLDSLGESALLS
jgi:hypothetical protein